MDSSLPSPLLEDGWLQHLDMNAVDELAADVENCFPAGGQLQWLHNLSPLLNAYELSNGELRTPQTEYPFRCFQTQSPYHQPVKRQLFSDKTVKVFDNSRLEAERENEDQSFDLLDEALKETEAFSIMLNSEKSDATSCSAALKSVSESNRRNCSTNFVEVWIDENGDFLNNVLVPGIDTPHSPAVDINTSEKMSNFHEDVKKKEQQKVDNDEGCESFESEVAIEKKQILAYMKTSNDKTQFVIEVHHSNKIKYADLSDAFKNTRSNALKFCKQNRILERKKSKTYLKKGTIIEFMSKEMGLENVKSSSTTYRDNYTKARTPHGNEEKKERKLRIVPCFCLIGFSYMLCFVILFNESILVKF